MIIMAKRKPLLHNFPSMASCLFVGCEHLKLNNSLDACLRCTGRSDAESGVERCQYYVKAHRPLTVRDLEMFLKRRDPDTVKARWLERIAETKELFKKWHKFVEDAD